MALVLGTRNILWNVSLEYGYYVTLFNLLFIGVSYLCVCCCLAEMVSALPYAGGIFGFVRTTLGPYYGFIVICMELLYCLCFIVYNVEYLLSLLSSVFPSFSLFYFILTIYGSLFSFCLVGGKPFWMVTVLLSVISLWLILSYLGGSAFIAAASPHKISYSRYCDNQRPFTFVHTLQGYSSSLSQYQGLQYLPCVTEFLKNPKKSISRLFIICCLIIMAVSVLLSISACSQAPGSSLLSASSFPLLYGFTDIFDFQETFAFLLQIPGIYLSIMTFLFCSSRQILLASKFLLFPQIFGYSLPSGQSSSVFGLLLVSCLSAAVTFCIHFFISFPFRNYFFHFQFFVNIVSLLSCFLYCLVCIVYLVFINKSSFSISLSLQRSFTNPFGRYGAMFGAFSYLYGCIAIIFFCSEKENHQVYYALGFLIVYVLIISIVYWIFIAKYQKVSNEEKKLLMKSCSSKCTLGLPLLPLFFHSLCCLFSECTK
jgi:amino acid transporter